MKKDLDFKEVYDGELREIFNEYFCEDLFDNLTYYLNFDIYKHQILSKVEVNSDECNKIIYYYHNNRLILVKKRNYCGKSSTFHPIIDNIDIYLQKVLLDITYKYYNLDKSLKKDEDIIKELNISDRELFGDIVLNENNIKLAYDISCFNERQRYYLSEFLGIEIKEDYVYFDIEKNEYVCSDIIDHHKNNIADYENGEEMFQFR